MWVQIERTILKADERTSKIPEDTAACDYIMHLNGFLDKEAEIGDEVTITTLAGRKVTGKLIRIDPEYGHSFGRPVEELMHIGPENRRLLEEVNNG
ncbi:MAG: 2-amino-4-oxopentanoate thiolase subunit OrtA [Candidatus Muiribacteriaceae bacterium]